MDPVESRDTYEILIERHRAGSIIVTSNRGPMSGWPPSLIRYAPRAPSTALPPTPSTSSSRASRTAVSSSRNGLQGKRPHDSVRRVSHPRPRTWLLRALCASAPDARPGGAVLASARAPARRCPRSLPATRGGAAAHNVDGDTVHPLHPATKSRRPTPPSTMWTAACAISAAKIGTRVVGRLN
jgi:hypothetical protein